MREKLETLSLAKLKEFAKEQEIKGYGSMRKAELIDILCAKAEEKEGISAPAVVSTGNDEPSANDGEPSKKAGEPVKREAEPAKEEKAPAPAQTQAAPANRVNPSEKKRTVVRSYRQEGTQRTGNYRQSQSDAVERNDRQDRPEQRQERNDRQERQEQRQDMNRMESIRETAEEARPEFQPSPELQELDSGVDAYGILEVMPDGFGFIRCENYLPGENDVYVAPSQIRRFNMKTGDIIQGSRRVKTAAEKFAALLFVKYINGYPASAAEHRPNFENMTPIFPNERLHMETTGGRNTTAMRVLDLLSPIGKGQRGMIVSPPKAGKTTLLKQVAKAVTVNHPDMHVIILLIDERPEEVTDIKESITGNNVEVLYSTFDELPERHKRVSEMVIERAKRLVEHGRDVIILLDSITRLARAYNLTVAPSGRTLSGGLDPAALHMPKRFFGAARNMREGGSLTILATALVDTGSRMDDVIYEEFKGTGNMELVLDRKLSEKRIFPAIDILKSGTRRDDLLLTREEAEAVDLIRKATNTLKAEDAVEKILDLFTRTRTNREFVDMSKKIFRY
ncbi:MAG: transcription termination factor Rho [Clostridiales bacterium]|nr:transcription termination factor Rho [Clostridiales bacterium]